MTLEKVLRDLNRSYQYNNMILTICLVYFLFPTMVFMFVNMDNVDSYIKMKEEECRVAHGASENYVNSTIAKASLDATDKPNLCAIACFAEKLGIMTSDGKINSEELRRFFIVLSTPPRVAYGTSMQCNRIAEDKCDTIKNLIICVKDKFKIIYH